MLNTRVTNKIIKLAMKGTIDDVHRKCHIYSSFGKLSVIFDRNSFHDIRSLALSFSENRNG